jgi:hypothetical protein
VKQWRLLWRLDMGDADFWERTRRSYWAMIRLSLFHKAVALLLLAVVISVYLAVKYLL